MIREDGYRVEVRVPPLPLPERKLFIFCILRYANACKIVIAKGLRLNSSNQKS